MKKLKNEKKGKKEKKEKKKIGLHFVVSDVN